MATLTATELWDALDDATIDAEIESARAGTPEERRRDLGAAGFNLDEVDAKADALFASLQPPAPIAAGACRVAGAGLRGKARASAARRRRTSSITYGGRDRNEPWKAIRSGFQRRCSGPA